MANLRATILTATTLIIALFSVQTASAQGITSAFQTVEPDHCNYEYAENVSPMYAYEFLGTRKKMSIEPGEVAEVTVYIQNTGTAPLYGDDSGCKFRPPARLGTTRHHDRDSILFDPNGWVSGSRISMDQKRLDPGEKGSFTFTIKAPQTESDIILKEYFGLVIEGKQWLENDFAVSFDIGQFIQENREYLEYIDYSRTISQEDLNGQRSIEVDISSQKMLLKVGDIVVRTFPISTGKWSTPTPYGQTTVFQKQTVRVSVAWPHYIMPQWMQFRSGGYGIHALPSIRYGNGSYWREALNHIGTRRSHGCIRLLPNDAVFAYEFAPIGTSVWVHE